MPEPPRQDQRPADQRVSHRSDHLDQAREEGHEDKDGHTVGTKPATTPVGDRLENFQVEETAAGGPATGGRATDRAKQVSPTNSRVRVQE